MPLTEFQRAVLRLLAKHRGPESFVAGDGAINATLGSPRYSDEWGGKKTCEKPVFW